MFKNKFKKIMLGALTASAIFSFSNTAAAYNTSDDGEYFYDELSKGGIEINEYYGDETDLVIPEKIDGKTVKIIGYEPGGYVKTGSFQEKGLNSVELPDSVKKIDNSAFEGNNLTSVMFPKSVEEIGFSAFKGNNLTSVTIPKNVKKLGAQSFRGNHIKNITIKSKERKFSLSEFRRQKTKDGKIIDHSDITVNAFPNSPVKETAKTRGYNFNPITFVDSTDLDLNVQKGNLLIDTEANDLDFKVKLTNDPTIAFDDKSLNYTIYDNRGVKENFNVQYQMSDFTHENGEDTLKPTENTKLNSMQQIENVNPENSPVVNNSLNVSAEFDNSDDVFVKSGVYHSTLTTEVIAAPK